MLIAATVSWGIWLIVGILALTISVYIMADSDNEESNSFLTKIIGGIRSLFAFAVLGLLLFGFYNIDRNYSSNYTIITANDGIITAGSYQLIDETTYEWLNGQSSQLSQTDGATIYLNDTSHDVVIHSVSYGAGTPAPDVTISAMKSLVDRDGSLTIDYIVQSFDAIKESDETGLKSYLIPVTKH